MSFGFGGTASHSFGGGLTGRSLSHAWSMGSESNNSHSSSQSSSTSLIGSLVALLYVPLFIVFYRQYFYTFDQHKLRHIAHSVEASLISSDFFV